MVLYICLIPNKGAGIGHQTYDYFSILTFCRKMNYNFVYHEFMGNSANFNSLLQFGNMHQYLFNDIKNKMEIIDLETIKNDFLKNLEDMNKLSKDICIFGHIKGNENIPVLVYDYINKYDVQNIKLEHRLFFNDKFPKLVDTNYLCIHLRCGDIINDTHRFIDTNYFIEKYNSLITKYDDAKNMPVYIITEYNFQDDDLLKENIPNCIILKIDSSTSLNYLINSTYLICSRSGFSNLAYILGNCKCVVAPNDWNHYYDNKIII